MPWNTIQTLISLNINIFFLQNNFYAFIYFRRYNIRFTFFEDLNIKVDVFPSVSAIFISQCCYLCNNILVNVKLYANNSYFFFFTFSLFFFTFFFFFTYFVRFHQDLNLLIVVHSRDMFVTLIYRLILFDTWFTRYISITCFQTTVTKIKEV